MESKDSNCIRVFFLTFFNPNYALEKITINQPHFSKFLWGKYNFDKG
jgi:hypothetical protein